MSRGDLNLRIARGGPSVWEQQRRRSWPPLERTVTGLGGAALIAFGIMRRSWMGATAVAAGTVLALTALIGRPRLWDVSTRVGRRVVRLSPGSRDLVHESSEESFPASDAPAWTPTSGSKTGG